MTTRREQMDEFDLVDHEVTFDVRMIRRGAQLRDGGATKMFSEIAEKIQAMVPGIDVRLVSTSSRRYKSKRTLREDFGRLISAARDVESAEFSDSRSAFSDAVDNLRQVVQEVEL